jgi:hypothetical protein
MYNLLVVYNLLVTYVITIGLNFALQKPSLSTLYGVDSELSMVQKIEKMKNNLYAQLVCQPGF